jgi:hypothetical protein
MIDLKGEPNTDSVRAWIQKGLTHFQTKDVRKTLLAMSLAGMRLCSFIQIPVIDGWLIDLPIVEPKRRIYLSYLT